MEYLIRQTLFKKCVDAFRNKNKVERGIVANSELLSQCFKTVLKTGLSEKQKHPPTCPSP